MQSAVYPPEVNGLFRRAVECRACFEAGWVTPAVIDLPQPPYVGPGYFASNRRILIMLVNPGSGQDRNDVGHRHYRELLIAYRAGEIEIDPILEFRLGDFPNWGTPRGRFMRFFIDGLGLDLREITVANIAWCSDKNNAHPRSMLEKCFEKHASALLRMLRPHIVLLSGSSIQEFRTRIEREVPEAVVIPTLHFAHREGHATEQAELARIRASLQRGNTAESFSDERETSEAQGQVTMPRCEGGRMGSRKGYRNVRSPYREGCNAAVAWGHVFPLLVQRQTVRTNDFANGFRRVPDNPEADLGNPWDRAKQFVSYLVGYGLIRRAGTDLWVRGPAWDDPRYNSEGL